MRGLPLSLVAPTRYAALCPTNWIPRAACGFASAAAARTTELQSVNKSPGYSSRRLAPLNRLEFDKSIRKNLFFIPAFDLYHGDSSIETRGLYDYGPPGCALQANIVDTWRKHFVLEEEMLEVDCTSLTPYNVLKASGHVDRFTDWLCKDPVTGDSFRADHLVAETLQSRLEADNVTYERRPHLTNRPGEREQGRPEASSSQQPIIDDSVAREYRSVLAKIDSCNGSELEELIIKHDIRSPTTGELLGPPTPFNLMFETNMGSKDKSGRASSAFLRPETAQGQFVNFQKLHAYNQMAMPFASASVGKCFRNEISPRSGIIRVREFLLAEIEHFIDPDGDKKHERFNEVADVELNLLTRDAQASTGQQGTPMSISHAVSRRIVDNETLGYFLARIQLFLLKCGIDPTKLRFRQHLSNEMAHYASDCWDAEVLTSYGWIECVGCADRSAYDLTMHSQRSGRPLTVRQPLETSIEMEQYEIEINRKLFGPHFRDAGKAIEETLLNLDQPTLEKLALELASNERIQIEIASREDRSRTASVTIDKNLMSISKRKRRISYREYTPNVVEPSFGVGRILYALLEHSWWTRGDGRGVLSFPPAMAPVKVLILPLSRHSALFPAARQFASRLRASGVSNRVDDSSTSIGRRYSRGDELGTPLAVTVDFQSLKDCSYTLRDRDSLEQVRASEDDICEAIEKLANGLESWQQVAARLPAFAGQQLE